MERLKPMFEKMLCAIGWQICAHGTLFANWNVARVKVFETGRDANRRAVVVMPPAAVVEKQERKPRPTLMTPATWSVRATRFDQALVLRTSW